VEHPKWSLRREIQIGILRRPEAPDRVVSNLAAKLPKPVIQEVLKQFKLPTPRKELLERALLRR